MLLETCKLQYRGNSRRRQAVQKNRCAAAFWKPTGRTCSCYRAAYRVILVRLEISYGKRERENERESWRNVAERWRVGGKETTIVEVSKRERKSWKS